MDELRQLPIPLLVWYRENARVLPWRSDPTPYHVWVSEIMLQQTRVAAVLDYYRRFLEAAPDVAPLAALSQDRLMKLWQGLGYYSRARNMQKAAVQIVEDYGGVFPNTYEAIRGLAGVGDYTAGAIASIAFSRPVPAVDGNVLRLAARVADIEEDIMDGKVRQMFRRLMEQAMPANRPGDFNQAMMDLGSAVCLPNSPPLCAQCPLAALCEANRLGRQGELPVRRKKAQRRREEMTVYLLLREGRVALRRREDRGLLAGLWEFPHVPGALAEAQAGGPVAAWGLTALDWRRKLEARHIFTHVEWHMTGYLLTVSGDCPALTWADQEALDAMAVPSAFGKFLDQATEYLSGQQQING